MLIGGDDISNDVITLGTFFNVCLHSRSFSLRADWRKSDTYRRQVATSELEEGFKFQRRSCKLSFLFLPRRQSTLESLLAD